VRNQVSRGEEFVRCGNVVSGLIPEVRKAQQPRVEQKNRAENQREQLHVADLWIRRSRKLSHVWRDSWLIHWPLLRKLRVELDLSKRALILRNVLLQDHEQRLRLLRAEVDSLKVCNLNFVGRLRAKCSKRKKEIPYADSHLYAVRIALAIVVGGSEFHIWRLWYWRHEASPLRVKVESLAYAKAFD